MTWGLKLKRQGVLSNPPPPQTPTLPDTIQQQQKKPPRKKLKPAQAGIHLQDAMMVAQTLTKNMQQKIQEANDFKPTGLPYRGCHLLSKFIRHHLAEQQRSMDEDHNRFVQKLARGEPISIDDIKTCVGHEQPMVVCHCLGFHQY